MLNFIEDFPDGEPSLKTSLNKTVTMGIDTEYFRKDENSNICLTWQHTVYNSYTGILKTHIHYEDYENEVRLDSNEILRLGFKLAGISDDEVEDYDVIVVAHFAVAELAMLRNRKQVVPFLEFLYKTVITFRPIDFPYITESGVLKNIKFSLNDTMLLLPPSHRSLEKASSLLDAKFHKKDLSADEKSDMLSLLLSDKARFEEYAIHDSYITLMLFFKLQFLLNSINETEDVIYTTIGSATVKHFQKFIKDNFPKGTFSSQFNQNNSIYKKGLDLASRAYMGGLNSSYFVGEVDGELILDVDFSSAYPNIMALLPISDYGEVEKKKKIKSKDFSLGLSDDS